MMGESRLNNNSYLKVSKKTEDEMLFKRPTTPSMSLHQNGALKNVSQVEEKTKLEEARKNIPSEMKSRPKLPRTPMNGDISPLDGNSSQLNNESQKTDPKQEQKVDHKKKIKNLILKSFAIILKIRKKLKTAKNTKMDSLQGKKKNKILFFISNKKKGINI